MAVKQSLQIQDSVSREFYILAGVNNLGIESAIQVKALLDL